jgi:hypothetical protein
MIPVGLTVAVWAAMMLAGTVPPAGWVLSGGVGYQLHDEVGVEPCADPFQ